MWHSRMFYMTIDKVRKWFVCLQEMNKYNWKKKKNRGNYLVISKEKIKIASVAMKIKKSILSNFFSIESTSKISHLRYEKLNFSSQNHRIDVNFFDYENWEQYLTFLFYTSGPQLPLSMRKIALLLKNGQKSSFFDEFKTWSKKISISEGPEKNFFGPKKIYGGLLHCKTWILVTKIGTSVQRIKVKSASEVRGCCLHHPPSRVK